MKPVLIFIFLLQFGVGFLHAEDLEEVNSCVIHNQDSIEKNSCESILNKESVESVLNQENVEYVLNQENVESVLNQENVESVLNQENVEYALNQENVESVLNMEIDESAFNKETVVAAEEAGEMNWNTFMKKAKWTSHTIVNHFYPSINYSLQSKNISESCVKALQQYIDGVKEWEPWAIKMADANGKIPSGLLSGTRADYGSYEQCLAVRANIDTDSSFKGKYCLVLFHSHLVSPLTTKSPSGKPYLEAYGKPPGFIKDFFDLNKGHLKDASLMLGMCMPSTCTEDDVHNFLNKTTEPWLSEIYVSHCEDDTPKEWPVMAKISVYLFSVLFAICFVATMVDRRDRRRREIEREEQIPETDGTYKQLLKSFSLVDHAAYPFVKREKSNNFDSLDGIRAILCAWVCCAHVLVYPNHLKEYKYTALDNVFTLLGPGTIYIENGFLIMEFFSVLSGCLLALQVNRLITRYGTVNLIEFYFKRYFRLMPVLIFMTMLQFAMPLLGNGPIWDKQWEVENAKCRDTWWRNLLMIQNYLDMRQICLLHSWYLAALMQIQIVCVVFLLIKYKVSSKLGAFLLFATMIPCIIHDYHVAFDKAMPNPRVRNLRDFDHFRDYITYLYINPINHYPTFVSGIILAWFLDQYRDIKLSPRFQKICWIITIINFNVLLFFNYTPVTDRTLVAIYYAIRNVGWSISTGWTFFCLVRGEAGFLGRFLSIEAFAPISRISYCLYVFHPIILLYREASRRERVYLSLTDTLFEIYSVFILSFVVAYIATITVELPFANVVEILTKKLYPEDKSPATSNGASQAENEESKDDQMYCPDDKIKEF